MKNAFLILDRSQLENILANLRPEKSACVVISGILSPPLGVDKHVGGVATSHDGKNPDSDLLSPIHFRDAQQGPTIKL